MCACVYICMYIYIYIYTHMCILYVSLISRNYIAVASVGEKRVPNHFGGRPARRVVLYRIVSYRIVLSCVVLCFSISYRNIT